MKHHSIVLIGVLALFLVIAAAGGGYIFYNYQLSQSELSKLKENPQTVARQEIKEVSAKIGALMELPKNEEPTLATVTDVNKLKNQQFFSQAVNGDKVLIYTQSSKAILYRPQTNKIIEVASVNLGQNQVQTQAQAQTQTPKLKVALYNGTTVKGATNATQKTISEKVSNVEIVDQSDAGKKDYTKTLIVDISGKQKEAATELSKVLGASVGPLPAGETKPKDADLLVILGK
jgi:hypothetical protein